MYITGARLAQGDARFDRTLTSKIVQAECKLYKLANQNKCQLIWRRTRFSRCGI